jgi:hypothetical protein
MAVKFSQFLDEALGSNSYLVGYNSAISQNVKVSYANLVNAFVGGSGTTNYVPKWTGSSALGNSQIFDDGTNAGIGTTSPYSVTNYKSITVNGTNGGILATQVNGTNAFNITTSSVSTYIVETRALPIQIGTNNIERVRISSNGNVGIGTDAPVSILEIKATSAALTLNNAVASTTNLGIASSGGSYSTDANTGDFIIRANSKRILLNTDATSAALIMHTTKNITVGSNTDAGFKFDVNGTARVSGNLTVSGPAGSVTNVDIFGGTTGGSGQTLRIYGSTPASQGLFLTYTTATAESFIDAGYHATSSGASFGDIIFRSKQNGTNTLVENMRVRGFNGSVGINNTSPGGIGGASVKLDVRGTTWFSADGYGQLEIIPTIGNGGETVIRQYTTSPRNGGDLRIRVDAAVQGGNFIIATNANNERMRVTSNGNVLIGTSTDGVYRLDVNGTARVREYLYMLRSDGNETAAALIFQTGGTIDIGKTFRVIGNRWQNTTSSTSYIENGYTTKNFVSTPTQNSSYSSFDFSNSGPFSPSIANPYTQKLINGAMTINSTVAGNNFHGVSISATDNSASIANNVFAVYADATLGTNTSANRWAGYFLGRGYFSQVLAIGTTSPNASALLDMSSTTQGFLPPRMTGAQAEAISSPAAGLMVYANNGNGATITSTGWWGYNGTTWVKLN